MFMNRTAVAKFYGVTPQTIRNWQADGKIPQPTRSPSGRAIWSTEHFRSPLDNELANIQLPEPEEITQ